MRRARILLIGRAPILLKTRCQVLQGSGFDVVTVTEVGDAGQVMSSVPIDLFILCHTLSPGERERALSTARSLRPEIKRLILEPFATREAESAAFFQENVLAPLQGPAGLLAKVSEILGISPEASAHPLIRLK